MQFNRLRILRIEASGNRIQFCFNPMWCSLKDGNTSEHKVPLLAVRHQTQLIYIKEMHLQSIKAPFGGSLYERRGAVGTVVQRSTEKELLPTLPLVLTDS